MSDIYLAISETPTVVTLTSAVIASSASSTVTVSNTVTVALDANSLSALENVTVTVGAAITGTVTVGNSVTISSLPAISGTVTASISALPSDFTTLIANGLVNYTSNEGNFPVSVNYAEPISGTVTIGAGTAQIGSVTASISGTVTVGLSNAVSPSLGTPYGSGDPYPVGAKIIPVGGWTSEEDGAHWQALSLTDGGALYVYGQIAPGTNRIGVVTIGGGTVTIGAGISQIGSVTASISNFPATQAISIASVTIGNSVTIGSLPAISGTVTANTFALQGTTVTTSNFTSTTASTVLAGFNATREVLTIFSEGPGTLFVSAGATCTTVQYQVRLSSGDYYEAPSHQSTITHSAVFATAGTARVTEVS